MFAVRKRTNIYKSIRKSISQEAISAKTLFQLAHFFESLYTKRPAVGKHAACHRPVRNHKYSVRKRTNI